MASAVTGGAGTASAAAVTPAAAAGAAETALQKQCRIKTSVVARLAKELLRYEEEAEAQRAKILKMRDAAADSHDIKKQEEVLEETENMLPDTLRRLNQSVDDLRAFVDTNEAALAGSKQLDAAKTALAPYPAASEADTAEEEI